MFGGPGRRGAAGAAGAATFETISYSGSLTSVGSGSLSLAPDCGTETQAFRTTSKIDSGEDVYLKTVDASLGTLTSVRFDHTAKTTTEISATLRCRDNGRSIDFKGLEFELSQGSVTTSLGIGVRDHQINLTATSPLFHDRNPDSTLATVSGTTRSRSNRGAVTYFDSNMFAFMTGTGLARIDVDNVFSAVLRITCNASLGAQVTRCRSAATPTTDDIIDLTVTYTYEPAPPPPPTDVPLPASALLLLAGFGAPGLKRRR